MRFAVQRARDLVILDVAALGMRLETAGDRGPRLVVEAEHAGEARLVVRFPPQHLGEEAWEEMDPTPPRDELAAARLAGFSRLVFAVPAGEEIEFSTEGVLAAMRRLPLVVVPLAQPRSDPKPRVGELLGHRHLPGGLVLAHSGTGPVLSAATRRTPVPVAARGVDDLIRDSAALRALRIHLAGEAAADLRPGPSDRPRPGGGAAIAERPLFGPGGLVVDIPRRRPRRPLRARAPGPEETAIEAPWRLVLSPSDQEGFTHADTPVGPADPIEAPEPATARERIEIWHSRLGIRRAEPASNGTETVSVDERTDRQRIVRAIWAREREFPEGQPDPDPEPFRSSLSPHDRSQLVLQSAETVGDIAPEPVDVKGLALSALGGWLDLHGAWEADRYSAQGIEGAIKSWDHIAPMGRDQFVQVVYVGYLYPLGHKAVLVKQTERKIRTPVDPVARLYQRFFIIVAEPERTHAVHDLPFKHVRFLTLVTPPLADPAKPGGPLPQRFWPTLPAGQAVSFSVETTDHDGRHSRLRLPLLFLDAAEVLGPGATVAAADSMYRTDPRALIPADGQRIAFAPSIRPGDTSAEVRTLRLDAKLEGRAGVGVGPWLQPRLRAAEIVPATSRLLTPAAETFQASYHPTFASKGFPAIAGSGGNAADVFLRVVDPEKVLADEIPPPPTLPRVSFGGTERSGGFVGPGQQIAGLSRALGTVGDIDGALAGSFDPEKLLGQASPMLFGLFRLTDLLPALGFDQAPRFITEALGPVQGLLADLTALQGALERASAKEAQLQAHADDLAAAVGALTDALAPLLDPTQPHDATAAAEEIEHRLEAFTATVDALTPLVATLPLPPLARTELDKLLRGVRPYVEDAQKIASAVKQVLEFVEGLDPENLEVRAKLDWSTPIEPFQIAGENVFEARDPLRIAVEARAGAKTGASFDAVAELTDFSLTLVPPASLMRMHFDRLAFRAGSAGKPDVDVVFGGIEFLGPLSFVETLKELIPLDGFSDPPFLDVAPDGVRAGFTLGLPNVAVGVFALQNISLGSDCSVPFVGRSVSVGFNFCSRERPFALTVAFIGGGGFFGVRATPKGLDLLELSLEAGARLAVDFGVASGSIEAMLGIYLRLEGQGGSLTGYFRLRGEVDVLGLISASIELSLELHYEFATGKMVGRATITIEVEVFMFSASVQVSAERRFAGSAGDPSFAQVMAVADDGSAPRWDDYCEAFA